MKKMKNRTKALVACVVLGVSFAVAAFGDAPTGGSVFATECGPKSVPILGQEPWKTCVFNKCEGIHQNDPAGLLQCLQNAGYPA